MPFDAQDLAFTLACPHANVTREIVSPATLSAEGVEQVTCADCGAVWEENFRAEIESADGRTRALLSPGAFSDGSDPAVTTEYIFGGADSDAARELFGTRLIRAFRIRFTAAGAAALPKEDVTVVLESEVEVPAFFALFVYRDGGLDRVVPEREGNVLTFPWQDALFLLVDTPPEEDEPLPDDGPEPSSETVTVSTRTPEEEKRRRDGIILAASGAALVVCGAGIVFLLRRGRRY